MCISKLQQHFIKYSTLVQLLGSALTFNQTTYTMNYMHIHIHTKHVSTHYVASCRQMKCASQCNKPLTADMARIRYTIRPPNPMIVLSQVFRAHWATQPSAQNIYERFFSCSRSSCEDKSSHNEWMHFEVRARDCCRLLMREIAGAIYEHPLVHIADCS